MKPENFLRPGDAGQETKTDPPIMTPGEPALRALFDSLAGMAYLARPDHARTIIFASVGGAELLGFAPDETSFSLAELIHPEEHDGVLDLVKSAVAGNHPFAIEYRLRHASGGWRTVWDQGQPVRFGQQSLVQGQLLDVTHRVQREKEKLGLELQSLQTQKLNALNQICGGVAHEFNNLVAGILGSAELLALDLPEKHPGHDTLKQIFEASNLARDFLAKLRAAGQRHPPELKPIRLQPVIEECVQILRTILPAKVELQTHVDSACPKVNADAAQMHQVILDLCLQAWQGLADRRGRIKISLETAAQVPASVGAAHRLHPGPHVCLTVRDNNSGLEKRTAAEIFAPFRVRRAGGKKIGLELFLVRETIHAHLGEILAEHEPGHGLAFRIYLPAAGDGR